MNSQSDDVCIPTPHLQNEPEKSESHSDEQLIDFIDIPLKLAARVEPFDSFWQTPKDLQKGYKSFYEYYKYNYLSRLPHNKDACILVISCGPGYLVNLLNQQGYRNVLGIDSDSQKIEYARERSLKCETHEAFSFLQDKADAYDVIIPEQELNHLTLDEMVIFLKLCWRSLRANGLLLVYGLNGANPLVGSENLAHNIDHFNTFTEYSLRQVLVHANFKDVRIFPLKLYVFWKNPLNYIGFFATALLELFFRLIFIMYGKSVTILTKKIAATCRKIV